MNYLNNLLAQIMQQPQAPMSPYTQGMSKTGTLDLSNRPKVQLPGGGYQTVYTMTAGIDNGKTVLLPRIVNGQLLSEKDAMNHFRNTGEHMGMFHSQEAADSYDKKLHADMGWNGKKNVWK